MFQKNEEIQPKLEALNKLESLFLGRGISSHARIFSSVSSPVKQYQQFVQGLNEQNRTVEHLFEHLDHHGMRLLGKLHAILNPDGQTQPLLTEVFEAALLMKECDHLNRDDLRLFLDFIQMQKNVLLSENNDQGVSEPYAFAYDLNQHNRLPKVVANQHASFSFARTAKILATVAVLALDLGMIATLLQHPTSTALFLATTTVTTLSVLLVIYLIYMTMQQYLKPVEQAITAGPEDTEYGDSLGASLQPN
ncbi:MAG: hypothetical protein CK424_03680 [Legionella sp.]|nr:MAG: hypothetical protein CK424_03680 [Legionella sp.]